jgi:hypothetical protein
VRYAIANTPYELRVTSNLGFPRQAARVIFYETANEFLVSEQTTSNDLIAQFTGLSLKQIEKLKKLSSKQSKTPKSSKTKRSL